MEDLQQCADAVMRLRAKYLYANNDLRDIDFYTEQGVRLNFNQWAEIHHNAGRAAFDSYLNKVFAYCSTRTLQKAQRITRPCHACHRRHPNTPSQPMSYARGRKNPKIACKKRSRVVS